MKNRLKTFGVFVNSIVGEKVKAKNIEDLLENRLSKSKKEFWSEIKFMNDEGQTIVINREFLEDQGMSINEVIEDWLTFATEDELTEAIHTI